MTAAAQSVPARHLEVISGALALVAGLMAIGVQLFAPLVTVHVTGLKAPFSRLNAGLARYLRDRPAAHGRRDEAPLLP